MSKRMSKITKREKKKVRQKKIDMKPRFQHFSLFTEVWQLH